MSEELIQRGLTEHGAPFGPFEYFSIGATTISQLRKFGIVPDVAYGKAGRNKPDGLLVDRQDPKRIVVLAAVEHKQPDEFDTPEKKAGALNQCVEDSCKPLGAKLAIATDGRDYLWANPQIPGDGYEPILREDGYPLDTPFTWQDEAGVEKTLPLVRRLLRDISPTNSQVVKEALQNPATLADRVWQTIWLASGENPDDCLATFVEIFVFKYLSDLGVLTQNDEGVAVSFADVLAVPRDRCLRYFFKNVRGHIKELFPASRDDGTSVINGTVLDPTIEEHNQLFHGILTEFEAFGPLTSIDPEFKSRLYENFLKKSISQKNWGQFFTPRNIVKAVVEMSGIAQLGDGARVHDRPAGSGGSCLSRC